MKPIKFLLTLSALLLFSNAIYSQAPTFTIKVAEKDTVYSPVYTVVCTTTPGNTAVINGKQVPVYKTGAFGAEITLQEGTNIIEIEVFNKSKRSMKSIRAFYANGSKPARSETTTMEEAVRKVRYNTLEQCNFNIKSLEGAYLQYTDADDRLGGTKIGYVEKDMVFKVVGVIHGLYKVQLSENRYAYLPVEYAEKTESDRVTVDTGTWQISNEGRYDEISIAMSERVPYTSFITYDPTTICIDLYGAECNSNWIVQKRNLGSIDYVDYRQIDSDVMRIILKLKNKYSWGYDINYEGGSLMIRVKNAPVSLSLKGMVIGVDAGHGGKSTGAVSITGLEEKTLNLSMAYELKSLLEKKGAKVVLSRTDDSDLSMAERKKIFKNAGTDLVVSIHCNASGSMINPMGTSAYYKKITDRPFAYCVLNRMLELGMPNYGLVGNFNFSLNNITFCPSILVETLFMSCLPEEEKLSNPAYRKTMMEQVSSGIEDYIYEVQNSLDPTAAKGKRKR